MSKVSKEEVEAFLHGSNPMEHIVKIECGYDDTKAKVYYRDENGKKQCQLDDFYPFCWAKQDASRRLYNGNRDVLKGEMSRYGITCKGLRTTKDDGTEPERMKNGYRILWYAIRPMTYQQFQRFFEDGGVPLSSRNKDGSDSGERNYVTVAPNEQHMIRTGKRLFKGYEDYDELVRMQWDLETTGLEPQKDTIEQIGIRTNKGFEKILTITGNTPEERLESQRKAMIEQYEIMRDIDPDVMSGYNSENFDWNFEIEQWKKYGVDMKDVTGSILREGIYKKKRETVLKLGGEMERFYPTVCGSINLTDGLFAVRRAMALDSNIKSATLKNISKDFKIKKKNRVYVPGIAISDIWNDTEEHYAFCEEDGDWYLYNTSHNNSNSKTPLTIEYFQKILANDCDVVDPDTGDIVLERSYPEGTTPEELYEVYLAENGVTQNSTEASDFKKGYNEQNGKFTMYTRSVLYPGYVLKTGRFIVERYLLDDIFETDGVELLFNQSNYQVSKLLPVSYERAATMGTASVWKAILLAWSKEHDTGIPETENVKLEVGGLSRQMLTGWVSESYKFDFNSLYPSIELSFPYFVDVDITDAMRAMLHYMLTTREKYKAEKKKWGKEIEKIKEQLGNVTDVNEIETLKNKLNIAKRNKGSYDKLQMSLKVCCNAWFGSVSSNIFNWNSSEVGHRITCTGRQMFRLLIIFMTKTICQGHDDNPDDYKYTPLIGDTDGINFAAPKKFRYTEENPYYCNGLGRNGVQGKAYIGAEADVQEFEDLYLRGLLGIDIDDVVPASIYIKRKNYIDLLDDGTIKLVGNSVKSKKMPTYIEKFIDKGVDLLLHSKGKEFIELYYDSVDAIYNRRIPLKDIASVGKIKMSIEDYKKACKELTKAGTKKSRQAWYELIIKNGLEDKVNMGDTVYFINTGSKKSQSDINRETKFFQNQNGVETDVTKIMRKEYDKTRKEWKAEGVDREKEFKERWKNISDYVKEKYPDVMERDEVNFNCVLLDRNIVEDEEDHFCDENIEYNVEKYLEAFNKRISILFVCFDRKVRERVDENGKVVSNILITNPKDRKEFTEEECRLVSGQPLNDSDQDKVEDVLRMEDKEIKFWMSVNEKPPFADECGMDWEAIKKDYVERMEVLKRDGIRDEVADFKRILSKLTSADYEAFMDEGELPNSIAKLCYIDTNSNNLMSKKFNVAIGTLYDIIDAYNDRENNNNNNSNEE